MKRQKRHPFETEMLLLEYLHKLTPKEQKSFIRQAPIRLLHTISELCYNLMQDNITLPAKDIEKLRPYESTIYKLSQKKHTTAQRRKIVQSGGFIGTLLSTVLPILVSTILSATSK